MGKVGDMRTILFALYDMALVLYVVLGGLAILLAALLTMGLGSLIFVLGWFLAIVLMVLRG